LFLFCPSCAAFAGGKSAPKGKVPFIEHDGVSVADSEFIVDYLVNTFRGEEGGAIGRFLPASGVDKERAAALHAALRMVEESTYFRSMYAVFCTPQGRSALYAHSMPGIPAPIRFFILRLVRQKVQQSIWVQGAGRHDYEDILLQVDKDFSALDALLGEHRWFSARDLPTTLDLAVFGMLAPAVFGDYSREGEGHFRAVLLRHPPLLRFAGRFLAFAFPDAVATAVCSFPEAAKAIEDKKVI
jgi:glutathione S-transferase